MTGLRRTVMAAFGALVWISLIIQLCVTLNAVLVKGGSVLSGITLYYSYFTILTNTLVALTLTWPVLAPTSRGGRFFLRPSVQAAVLLYIVVVGITFTVLLRQEVNLGGWAAVCNVLLHYVVPVLFPLYWLAFAPKGELRWSQIGSWLLYPITYFVFVIVAGARTAFYPYPFVNVTTLGYNRVVVNSLGLVIGFVVLAVIVIWLDRMMGRAKPAVVTG